MMLVHFPYYRALTLFSNDLQPAAQVTDGIGSTTSRIHTQTGSRANRPTMNTVPWLRWKQKTVSGGLKVVLSHTVWPVKHQKVSFFIKWKGSTIL